LTDVEPVLRLTLLPLTNIVPALAYEPSPEPNILIDPLTLIVYVPNVYPLKLPPALHPILDEALMFTLVGDIKSFYY
jgi:hypothetical protein